MQSMQFDAEIPNTVFGIKSDKTTKGFTPDSFPEGRRYVPPVDDRHVFPLKEFLQFRTWWLVGENEPMTLAGPQGSGKTSFVREFAGRLHIPVYSYTCHRYSEKWDLIGGCLPIPGNGMRWFDGPVTKAYRHGGIVLINEPSLAQDLGPAINDLTEGAPIEIPQTDEVLPRHPNCRIVFTDNLRGLVGDESGMLQGRNLQDASAKDRDHQIWLDYMDEDSEIELLKKYMPEFGPDAAASAAMKQELAKGLRDFAADVRRAYVGADPNAQEQLECTMSTRTLLRFLKLFVTFRQISGVGGIDPLYDALDQALTAKVGETSRKSVHKLANTHLGSGQ
jgi:cobaltochelatase CobS